MIEIGKIFTFRFLIYNKMDLRCKDCAKCCYETEMLLSEQDIERILQKFSSKFSRKDFVIENEEGLNQLKNVDGHCVFLDSTSDDEKCHIYHYRPCGCRFYPMIFDPYKRQCVLDRDCPNANQFYIERQNFKKACQKLKKYLTKELSLEF
ncbi:MAG: YkgJ family cysteine cluster protein [Promethearchaeia archaeon]